MVEIDARGHSVREVNRALREAAEAHDHVVLTNPEARHNLAVGIVSPVRLTIRGSAGYFCAGLCDGVSVTVEGNVGWGFADNLLDGEMVVEGNAGAVCGIGMRGGSILVKGNMGSRAGQVMKDGSIVCCGNAGFRAGSMMMGGTIIVLGDAREAVGEFMMDGKIYVAGTVNRLGTDAAQAKLRDGDVDKISAILAAHGLSHPGPWTKVISDQRALRYQEYENKELLYNEQQAEGESAVLDGNRDVMAFDAD